MFQQLPELSGKKEKDAIRIIESYLRAHHEELEYILTHLDSSNIIEIDTSKTTIYEGEKDEL